MTLRPHDNAKLILIGKNSICRRSKREENKEKTENWDKNSKNFVKSDDFCVNLHYICNRNMPTGIFTAIQQKCRKENERHLTKYLRIN